MSTATLMTVVESYTSRDGMLAATVLLIGDRHVVDLDDVRTGQTIDRLTYTSLLDASRAARSLAWGETSAVDAEEDEAVHAMLAEVADAVAEWKDETPTPTPSGVSETPALATPTPVPAPALQASALETPALTGRPVGSPTFAPSKRRQAEHRPVKGFVRTPHGRFPVRAVSPGIRAEVVAMARDLSARLETLRNANRWQAAAELEREMGEFARSHGLGSSWVDVYNV